VKAPTGPAASWDLGHRRLYLCSPDRPDLEVFIDRCVEGGVDIVQLRDKRLTESQVVARAALVQRVCAHHGVPFILNDRPDLAADIGADGVHVGQEDMAPDEARRLVGPRAVIGLSTHGPDDLARAVRYRPGPDASDGAGHAGGEAPPAPAPVDYISAGPVTPTPTKPGRAGTGLGYVSHAARSARWPVWVTGGVDPSSVPAMTGAGARHFVVVRWLTEADDPGGRARMLRRAIDEAVDDIGDGSSDP
jgi:thiamine-phosphate pyrophosphorylase